MTALLGRFFMTYEEFMNYVRDSLEEILGENVSVKIRQVLKNNDIELDALTILKKESNISPTIYMNYYYEEYQRGIDIGEIISEIYELYEEQSKNLSFNVDDFMDFDKIKGKIMYKLINTSANEKLLKEIPSIPFLDLSIVFYCMINNDYIGSATTLIHNVHMDIWGKNCNDLFELAKVNTPKIMQYELKDMNELIKEILIGDIEKTICENDNRYDENCNLPSAEEVADGLMRGINDARSQIAMYVLTNKQRINGAVCMLYEDVIKEFSKKMGKDIYILPSSVHEVILVPADEFINENELSDMVSEVNREELDKIDVLSEHVYYYNAKRDKIFNDSKSAFEENV